MTQTSLLAEKRANEERLGKIMESYEAEVGSNINNERNREEVKSRLTQEFSVFKALRTLIAVAEDHIRQYEALRGKR